MQKEIITVLRYFLYFSYPPTLDEIHAFLTKKVSRKTLIQEIRVMVKAGRIVTLGNPASCRMIPESILDASRLTRLTRMTKCNPRYTIEEYSIKKAQSSKRMFENYKKRHIISQKKLQKIMIYVKILSWFPQIRLVGISGSVAMMNAQKKDDIDLFIITAKDRLWTGRLIAVMLAQILGLRRSRGLKKAQDKVCLNLFFDEKDLGVGGHKKTAYVAHEILQMKPVINKSQTYDRFLSVNRWVKAIFPNIYWLSSKCKVQNSNLKFKTQIFNNFKFLTAIFNFSLLAFNSIGNRAEYILKCLQLNLINKHKSKEIITDTQLWFFPQDFEFKIKKKRFFDNLGS